MKRRLFLYIYMNNHSKEISFIDCRSAERADKIKKVVDKRQPTLTIVLENVHDPHNVSAVIRSCDAVGILDIHFVYHSGQSFPVLAEKSSASARKWVFAHRHNSIEDCFKLLRQQGKSIFTTAMSVDSVSLYEMNLTQPIALVFGNEHNGVSETALQLADGNFLIPQVGMIQSLNISVACSVTIYEAFRQRMIAGMYNENQLKGTELQQYLNMFSDNSRTYK